MSPIAPVIIADNEYITLQYLPDKKALYHTIHKPVDEGVFKTVLNAGTEALGKYKATKWLSDDRKNGALSPELMDWAANDWDPRTIAAGWKYWANVVPEQVVGAGALIPVMETLYQFGLRMMVFSSLEKAWDWLDKVDR